MPFFATGLNYSPTGNSFEGQKTPAYHATLGMPPLLPPPCATRDNANAPFRLTGFYFISLGLLTCIYLVCSLRTNICLFSALFLLIITFSLIAGSYFQLANGSTELAEKLQVVS